jgi:hypothetical protein
MNLRSAGGHSDTCVGLASRTAGSSSGYSTVALCHYWTRSRVVSMLASYSESHLSKSRMEAGCPDWASSFTAFLISKCWWKRNSLRRYGLNWKGWTCGLRWYQMFWSKCYLVLVGAVWLLPQLKPWWDSRLLSETVWGLRFSRRWRCRSSFSGF